MLILRISVKFVVGAENVWGKVKGSPCNRIQKRTNVSKCIVPPVAKTKSHKSNYSYGCLVYYDAVVLLCLSYDNRYISLLNISFLYPCSNIIILVRKC